MFILIGQDLLGLGNLDLVTFIYLFLQVQKRFLGDGPVLPLLAEFGNDFRLTLPLLTDGYQTTAKMLGVVVTGDPDPSWSVRACPFAPTRPARRFRPSSGRCPAPTHAKHSALAAAPFRCAVFAVHKTAAHCPGESTVVSCVRPLENQRTERQSNRATEQHGGCPSVFCPLCLLSLCLSVLQCGLYSSERPRGGDALHRFLGLCKRRTFIFSLLEPG